jgi:hypothetical protein
MHGHCSRVFLCAYPGSLSVSRSSVAIPRTFPYNGDIGQGAQQHPVSFSRFVWQHPLHGLTPPSPSSDGVS